MSQSTTKDLHREVIASHAKSFYWAAKLLPRESFWDVCLLYHFCRMVDDTADGQESGLAISRLNKLKAELVGTETVSPLIQELHLMFSRRAISIDAAIDLIRGAEMDQLTVRLADDDQLIQYCYYVAGTVGLMMQPLVGAKAPEAKYHAIDLGIAMQLTNICRDVLEDARMDRVYLPESRLLQLQIKPEEILNESFDPQLLGIVVSDILDLADRYYESAIKGYHYIHWRPRLSILVAGLIYRDIGRSIRKQNFDVFRGRAYVGFGRKLWLTSLGMCKWLRSLFAVGTSGEHDATLHAAIQKISTRALLNSTTKIQEKIHKVSDVAESSL